MRWLRTIRVVSILAAVPLFSQVLPDFYTQEIHGDPPFLSEPGWKPLLNGNDLTGWRSHDGRPHGWLTTRAVNWRRVYYPKVLIAKPDSGDRIVNGKEGRAANLVSAEQFGDFELFIEFMNAKGTNSGVYLHGLYEVQIFDSYGYGGQLTVGDCGGIYNRPDGTGGSPPLRNACRQPGEWQSLQIWFQAPRFDSGGKKITNARVLRVLLNEVLIQDTVELGGPTGSHLNVPEAPANPLMLQGDHGPIAFRNIYIRPLSSILGRSRQGHRSNLRGLGVLMCS